MPTDVGVAIAAAVVAGLLLAALLAGCRRPDREAWELDGRLAADGTCRWRSVATTGRCDRPDRHRGAHSRDPWAPDPILRGATGVALRRQEPTP